LHQRRNGKLRPRRETRITVLGDVGLRGKKKFSKEKSTSIIRKKRGISKEEDHYALQGKERY